MKRPLHEDYRATYEEVVSRLEPEEAISHWLTVQDMSWDTWPDPTIGAVSGAAAGSSADVIRLVPPLKRKPKDALAELNGLRFVSNHEEVVLSVVGDEETFVMRSFLLQAGGVLDGDNEEVIQDLVDFAQERGLKTAVVVA